MNQNLQGQKASDIIREKNFVTEVREDINHFEKKYSDENITNISTLEAANDFLILHRFLETSQNQDFVNSIGSVSYMNTLSVLIDKIKNKFHLNSPNQESVDVASKKIIDKIIKKIPGYKKNKDLLDIVSILPLKERESYLEMITGKKQKNAVRLDAFISEWMEADFTKQNENMIPTYLQYLDDNTVPQATKDLLTENLKRGPSAASEFNTHDFSTVTNERRRFGQNKYMNLPPASPFRPVTKMLPASMKLFGRNPSKKQSAQEIMSPEDFLTILRTIEINKRDIFWNKHYENILSTIIPEDQSYFISAAKKAKEGPTVGGKKKKTKKRKTKTS